MKKTIKTKLRLNSQTIRHVRAGLKDVQGGYVTALCAPTWNCGDSDACRGCG